MAVFQLGSVSILILISACSSTGNNFNTESQKHDVQIDSVELMMSNIKSIDLLCKKEVPENCSYSIGGGDTIRLKLFRGESGILRLDYDKFLFPEMETETGSYYFDAQDKFTFHKYKIPNQTMMLWFGDSTEFYVCLSKRSKKSGTQTSEIARMKLGEISFNLNSYMSCFKDNSFKSVGPTGVFLPILNTYGPVKLFSDMNIQSVLICDIPAREIEIFYLGSKWAVDKTVWHNVMYRDKIGWVMADQSKIDLFQSE